MIKENDFYKHIYADYYEYLKEKNIDIDYFDLDISYIPADINLAPNYIRLDSDYVDGDFIDRSEIIKFYIIDSIDGEPYINEEFEEGFYVYGHYYSKNDIIMETRCFIVGENTNKYESHDLI